MAPGFSWYKQGLLFKKEGNYRRAINCFNNALINDPKDAASIYNKAMCLDRMGKIDEACQTFFQALSINPNLELNLDSLVLWINVCKLLETKGDYQTALILCEKASIRFPKNVVLINQRLLLQTLLKTEEIDGKKQIKSKYSEYLTPTKKAEKIEVISKNSENIIEKTKNVSIIQKSNEISKPELSSDETLKKKSNISKDKNKKILSGSGINALFDYYGKKAQFGLGINPKHDFISSKILNLKRIDEKNEAARIENKKYVLSGLDIERITFFAEKIEPLIDENWVICVMPKSKKAREPSGIRILAKKLCKSRFIDGTDVIYRPVDREPRHVDGKRDYQIEKSSLQIADNNLIKGKTVLLLDDITTTGNSLNAGKRLLLSNGSAQVIALALGKTCY